MSSPTPTAVAPVAPFEVYSVHFNFLGGRAIKLRDPTTNLIIGMAPEWVVGGRNELAAYVRATRPEMRVVFRGTPAADGTYMVGADGTPFQVQEQQVTLAFDAGTGLSNALIFRRRRRSPRSRSESTRPSWTGTSGCSLPPPPVRRQVRQRTVSRRVGGPWQPPPQGRLGCLTGCTVR